MDSRVQMPVQKRANQRTAEFFHRDANEAVAERLPADLFELSTSFQTPGKPVDCAEASGTEVPRERSRASAFDNEACIIPRRNRRRAETVMY